MQRSRKQSYWLILRNARLLHRSPRRRGTISKGMAAMADKKYEVVCYLILPH